MSQVALVQKGFKRAPAKFLVALAVQVRLAVAGKFPIIPKGYSILVELWGIMVELWVIMVEL